MVKASPDPEVAHVIGDPAVLPVNRDRLGLL